MMKWTNDKRIGGAFKSVFSVHSVIWNAISLPPPKKKITKKQDSH